jgi:hypothetical protein
VIRVWNPEETFYSQNLRNWSFTVFFLFFHFISIYSFIIEFLTFTVAIVHWSFKL